MADSVFIKYQKEKELVNAINKIIVDGEAGVFVNHELTTIPHQFPLAWADTEMRDLMLVAFHGFGFDVTDIGSSQYRLDNYPG